MTRHDGLATPVSGSAALLASLGVELMTGTGNGGCPAHSLNVGGEDLSRID